MIPSNELEKNHWLLRVRNLVKKHYVAIQAAFSKLGITLDGRLLEPEPKEPEALKTMAFVDFEHWYVALQKIHSRRPNVQAWFDDLRTRGRLVDVAFFGNFSDDDGMRDELDQIRRFTNHIVETKNAPLMRRQTLPILSCWITSIKRSSPRLKLSRSSCSPGTAISAVSPPIFAIIAARRWSCMA